MKKEAWVALLLFLIGVIIFTSLIIIISIFYSPKVEACNLEIWLTMRTTGYTAEEGFTGLTSCGYQAGWGIGAIDPDYIPYGSILYFPAYADLCGRFVLCVDCGSGVKGYHLDVWTETNEQAYALTGYYRVRVLRWGWDNWLVPKNDWF